MMGIGAREHRRSTTPCRTRADRIRTPVVPGARRARRVHMPVVPGARRAERVRTPVVPCARRHQPSRVPDESRSLPVVPPSPVPDESRSRPVVPPSPVRGRVPVSARRLPCPGPTWPGADAANRYFEPCILVVCRGVPSGPVQRRGSGWTLGGTATRKAVSG